MKEKELFIVNYYFILLIFIYYLIILSFIQGNVELHTWYAHDGGNLELHSEGLVLTSPQVT